MVCFMYREGCVGKMTRILLSHGTLVCLCVCVSAEPPGTKHWSPGSTQETWMTLVSMFSSLGQQDNLLTTWCVPLVLYYSAAQGTCSFQCASPSALYGRTNSSYSKWTTFAHRNKMASWPRANSGVWVSGACSHYWFIDQIEGHSWIILLGVLLVCW